MNEKEFESFDNKKYYRNKICYILLGFNSGLITLSDLAIEYYLKDVLEVEPSSLANMTAFTKFPYIIKFLFGLITDLFPIFGYRRKLYILIISIIYDISWIIVIFIVNNIYIFLFLIFIINSCISFSTVIAHAILIETTEMENNNNKSDVSLYFLVKNLGMLIASYIKGILLEKFSIKITFYVSAFNSIFLFISYFLFVEVPIVNDNNNVKVSIQNSQSNNKKELSSIKKSFISFKKYLYNKDILFTFTFLMILVSCPTYNEALFYFTTNKLNFTPYYFGNIHTISVVVNLFFILLYKKYLSKLSFKSIIIIAKICLFVVLMLNYFLIKQNITNLISNYYLYMFIYSMNMSLITLRNLPIFEIGAILSPKNLEGTVYAIFMGILNFGQIAASFLGSLLMKYFSISKNNFTNLIIMINIINLIGILPLGLIGFIPKKYLQREISTVTINKEEEDNKHLVRIEVQEEKI